MFVTTAKVGWGDPLEKTIFDVVRARGGQWTLAQLAFSGPFRVGDQGSSSVVDVWNLELWIVSEA